jgi:arylsulfatase A-like enzyme
LKVVLSAVALLLVLATACSPRGEGASVRLPNVVLVVVDTLRADHLGCYGYPRKTSPRIDAFAATATRYARASSAAPWTVPSHASLFTGKPPFAHGAHTFAVERPVNNVNPLPEQQLTLAEALRELGFRTGAFVANAAFLAPHWNLDQGFDTYEVKRVYADALNVRVFEWLESAAQEQPFLLFVNYIDAHGPYDTRPRPGVVDGPVSDDPNLLQILINRVLPAQEPVPADLAQRVIDQYDVAIANVDAGVGALLDRIAALGLDENTVVVVTSDHGEFFGEHQLVAHSKDVYQEVLRVPLIVRRPGQTSGAVVDAVTISNDVPGLVASEFPEPTRSALRELFPELPGNHVVVAENYYTRRKDLFHPEWGWRFQRIRRAVLEWPHKYIDSSDGAHELYDLAADPKESRNLVADRPDVAVRLAADLRDYEASLGRNASRSGDEPLDRDLLENLKALGYVGD